MNNKKKGLEEGSSKDFSKALDELIFKYSALSIKTILKSFDRIDLLRKPRRFLTCSIFIYSFGKVFSSKKKFGCVLF